MPNRLIDTNAALNSATTGSIAIPLTAAPTLYGGLSLNLTTAGPNLRVLLTTTVTISSALSVLAPIVITFVRVVGGVTTTIFSATETVPVGNLALSTTVISANGIDYNPPADFVVYRALISSPGLLLFPTRVGPEAFRVEAYSD